MMNLRRWLTVVVFTLSAVLAQAASPADEAAEAITNDLFAQLDRVIDVVQTVKDEDSANKAADQLKVIEDKLRKINEQIRTAEQPSKEESVHMMEQLKKKLPEFRTRLNATKDQIHAAGPAAAATVGKAVNSIFQTLQAFGENVGNRPPQPATGK
ncbi:hypothetical protein CfE428DRAFT_3723 [Chthoniobacter flavus Ellin428]|uniref:Secreted protein n=1 Tax=Chthoniobacter flavus Ellin428 TaxID=497964 RepID=B4D485_9BACT|nr:hypothetical protein [Chthoniobacter flavus]EDY18686.1 hypothetical protein CfE428DRAFT_3723 [Chthoniobacter flavus Ellin428]TCO89075.1 hypothetical protein EV701_115110 [Chthoniobacter flavus]